LVTAIDRVIADVRPTAIYTHWLGDSHPEHIAMTRAVLASARRNTSSLYMYEATLPGGISPDPFHAQKFVDISDTIDAKMASLACYDTQLEAYGQSWLDAIRGRAAYRGFQMGRPYAEAFSVVKDITMIADLR